MMLKSYYYVNWKSNTPSNFVEYMMSPTSYGLRIVNAIFQKIFNINGKQKFMVHFTSRVSGNITLGKDVVRYMANSGGCYIQGINGIEIGDFTMIAPGVKIISANHNFINFENHDVAKKIKIGKKCWIGANACILPNVELGNNVIVAAGSVVTKTFPDNCIIAGVPAKIIKNLESV